MSVDAREAEQEAGASTPPSGTSGVDGGVPDDELLEGHAGDDVRVDEDAGGGGRAPTEPAMSDEAVDAVVEALRAEHPDDRPDVREAFARASLKRVSRDQLRLADEQVVATHLGRAFDLLDARERDEIAVRVGVPETALDGMSDPATVVQAALRDSPFLVATVLSELGLRDLDVRRAIHPVLGVERGDDGRITAITRAREAPDKEAFLHVELTAQLDDETAEDLRETILRLLDDVHAATDDFEAMRTRIAEHRDHVDADARGHDDDDEVDETVALLDWLLDDNFLMLGVREYDFAGEGDERTLVVQPESGLGLLRDAERSRYAEPVRLADLPEDLEQRMRNTSLLHVSRTSSLSTVRRRTRMEEIGVHRVGADGEVVGEFRLLGLFTRKGYAEPAQTIPVLRRKLDDVLAAEDVVRGSHDERTIVSLFGALPKDELFHAGQDHLHATILGLLQGEEQGRVRVLVRDDAFTGTVSVIAGVPREQYGPELRRDVTALLMERYDAERVDVNLSLADRAEAVARFQVDLGPDGLPDVDTVDLQDEIRRLARSWIDDVGTALVRAHGQTTGERLTDELADRLPPGYRDLVGLSEALHDIGALDRLRRSDDDLHVALLDDRDDDRAWLRVKAYRRGEALELSDVMPVLESLGLRVVEEHPHRLDAAAGDADDDALIVHDYGVRTAPGVEVDVRTDGRRIADAVLAAHAGRLEVDSLNRLVLTAGLDADAVSVLRAYRRYRRQVGTTYTPETFNAALVDNPDAAVALHRAFEVRFDPEQARDDDEAVEQADDDVLAATDAIVRLDHDRIVRDTLELVRATLRTNAYRTDLAATDRHGDDVGYLSFKLDPSLVPQMPKPVPHREIFVSSPLVEGVHLRGGPIARGGLRWSDRADDVRTEVLGLMKAQVLKNAVIVPTGAKGGFVLKRRPADPQQLRAAVEAQYRTFVRGLLDVTDNLVDGEVVGPPDVVRRDGDDPYLVVAADRGTATFSDTANALAEEYGYWLGDAFASGGSNGYDHKALGITARGAWVAVQRHFRELGIDTQTEPIRTAGVGDMSGDVFGNGMLRSHTIELVAAFDHRHVFLDPDPDAEASFAERERLFELGRSSWDDYDRDVISEGGGVWSRELKSIPLSEQVRELLKVDAEALPPAELLSAVLCAPVDLLWFGGIGTYVKASDESHDTIGDRANDELRVDGDEVRARVIGEGANLAVTQLGRIQYARRGGNVNLDAIDNVGGVDSSDHEVNLKILLDLAVADGTIDVDERNDLLVEVTDDVVASVLHDVDSQTLGLSQAVARTGMRARAHEELMRTLEDEDQLDRGVDHLPSTARLEELRENGAGLSRPELAVLLGHVKRTLTADLVASDLPDDPSLHVLVERYVPDVLVERFGDEVRRHRLRRELVATRLANLMVDRLGITFAFRAAVDHGVDRAAVLGAAWTAVRVLGADELWDAVAEHEAVLPRERFVELLDGVDDLVRSLARSYLFSEVAPHEAIERDRPVRDALDDGLAERGTSSQRGAREDRRNQLADDLVDDAAAGQLAAFPVFEAVPIVAATVRELGVDVADADRGAAAVTDAVLVVDEVLHVPQLAAAIDAAPVDGRWARSQAAGLAGDLRGVRRGVLSAALSAHDGPAVEAVRTWLEARTDRVERAVEMVESVTNGEPPTRDALAVAVRTIAAVMDR